MSTKTKNPLLKKHPYYLSDEETIVITEALDREEGHWRDYAKKHPQSKDAIEMAVHARRARNTIVDQEQLRWNKLKGKPRTFLRKKASSKPITRPLKKKKNAKRKG